MIAFVGEQLAEDVNNITNALTRTSNRRRRRQEETTDD
jgi:hypothetical protein